MADNYTPRVKSLLRENGCTFVRQGKGDHYTLKQAGLPKAF
jgi:hypothetical protein